MGICDRTFWRRKFERDYGVLGASQATFDYKRAFYLVNPNDLKKTWLSAIRNDIPELKRWVEERDNSLGRSQILTGVPSIDREILLHLDDQELSYACRLNK